MINQHQHDQSGPEIKKKNKILYADILYKQCMYNLHFALLIHPEFTAFHHKVTAQTFAPF